MNVDAFVPANDGVSFGVVVRDEEGQILMLATLRTSHRRDCDMEKVAADRFGLEIARRYGYTNVALESDSLNVIRLVRNGHQGAAPIFHFFSDIKRLCLSFVNFECSHVRRAGNTLAHLVARRDTGPSSELICMNSFPQSFQTLVDLDLMI